MNIFLKNVFKFGVLLLFFVGPAQAYNLTKDLTDFSAADLKSLDSFFVENGYDIYQNRIDFNIMPEVDRLYVSSKSKFKVFVKLGSFVNDRLSQELLKFENGYLVNLNFRNKLSTLYFSGFEDVEVKSLRSRLQNVSSARASLFEILIPKAQANYETCNNDIFPTNPSEANKNGYVRATWGCLKGMGFGVWNASGGAVVDLAKTMWAGSSSAAILMYCRVPIKSTELACQEMSDQIFASAEKNFEQVSNMIVNLNQVLSTSYSKFDKLDAETKNKIRCEVISTITVSGAMAYASFGASSSSFVLAVHQAMEKLNLSKMKVPAEFVSEVKNTHDYVKILGKKVAQFDSEQAEKLAASYSKYTKAHNEMILKKVDLESHREDMSTFKLIDKAVQDRDRDKITQYLSSDIENYQKLRKMHPAVVEEEMRQVGARYITAKRLADRARAQMQKELRASEKSIDDSKLTGTEKKLLRAQFLSAHCSMAADIDIDTKAVSSKKTNSEVKSSK